MRTAIPLALALSCAVACAPKMAPTSIASTPGFPDFVAPVVPPRFVGTPEAADQARGWALLQAGDLDRAEREFVAAPKGRPMFYAAEGSLGYLELAAVERKNGNGESALDHLRTAVWLDPGDAQSLAEIGHLLEERLDFDGAVTAYRQALAIEPSAEVEGRLDAARVRAELSRL